MQANTRRCGLSSVKNATAVLRQQREVLGVKHGVEHEREGCQRASQAKDAGSVLRHTGASIGDHLRTNEDSACMLPHFAR
jgi:hypothetical protein